MSNSAQPAISAIIPIRNRSGVRLENCVRSLRWQTGIDPADLEIVLSDFGSTAEHLASVRVIAARYDARVVSTDTDVTWNRSRALNIGIQRATARLVFCTDADMIFAPDFVAQLLALEAEHGAGPGPGALVVAPCFDLPEGAADQLVERADFARLRGLAAQRETGGTGACQVATRAFFEAVRGYDEAFQYWGAEDDDLAFRAARYGLKRVPLGAASAMLHQWHPTMKHDRPWQRWRNKWRYKLTRWRVVKNRGGWGVRGTDPAPTSSPSRPEV